MDKASTEFVDNSLTTDNIASSTSENSVCLSDYDHFLYLIDLEQTT